VSSRALITNIFLLIGVITNLVTSRYFLFRFLLLFTCQDLQKQFEILEFFYLNIRLVVLLHDGTETEDAIGEWKAQQKCHKSWKRSEIARKPYVV